MKILETTQSLMCYSSCQSNWIGERTQVVNFFFWNSPVKRRLKWANTESVCMAPVLNLFRRGIQLYFSISCIITVHNMIGLLPFKITKSLVYKTWNCLTTGELMQNGASRPLLVLTLWPQLSEKSICLYLAFYFDLRSSRWVQFLNNFQIHTPPLVDIYALVSKSISSWCQFHSSFGTLRQEEIRMLPCVACVFHLCAIFSPLPQVHVMVSVAAWS